ncbi:hypothetical protein E2C01_094851 [Portunus trituberculatus]|uniref:Uncharacterized protein n=1 Tax=Portunus trituberculatus TaxID=210409 RepID=A0A5B7K2S5_PORTR|nr:hypothetical protein [Portunus trituberculatus]
MTLKKKWEGTKIGGREHEGLCGGELKGRGFSHSPPPGLATVICGEIWEEAIQASREDSPPCWKECVEGRKEGKKSEGDVWEL